MSRDAALVAALDRVIAGERSGAPVAGDPWSLGLAAFEASWAQEHAVARRWADAALVALPARWADDPAAAVLACAARALAAAGEGVGGGWASIAPGTTPSGDPIADALPLLPALDDGAPGALAGIALGEAAIASARIDVAAAIAPAMRPRRLVGPDGREHPFGAVGDVVGVRIAAFHGRVGEAADALAAIGPTGCARVDRLVTATGCLVTGNAADRSAAVAFAEEAERAVAGCADRLDSGVLLLAAFGLVAVGEAGRSAALGLRTIGGARDPMLVDRALVLELALAAAELDGDLDAAHAWVAAAEPLADDAIVASTVARMRGRLALLDGDPTGAVALADHAIALARAEGRAIEAAEGEIVAARAMIAAGRRGEAGRRLSSVAADGDRAGHRAVRRSAAAALRAIGRRLPPAPGGGAASLSPREREVHELLLAGLGNAAIAARLHLSPHTVRVHVSRVLAAAGAPTRFALAAAAGRSAGDGVAVTTGLTARQAAVVRELCTGASNPEIAARLGIAVRTVEKHLGAVRLAWSASGRAEIVAIASGARGREE